MSQSLTQDTIPVPLYGRSRSKISVAVVMPYDGHETCDVATQMSEMMATDVICSSLDDDDDDGGGPSVDDMSTNSIGRRRRCVGVSTTSVPYPVDRPS